MSCRVVIVDDLIHILQNMFTKEFLKKYNLTVCNSPRTTMLTNAIWRPRVDEEEHSSHAKQHQYQTQASELLYPTVCRMLGIKFAYCAVSRSLHAASARYVTVIPRSLLCFSRTKHLGHQCKSGKQFAIKIYTDSDWMTYSKARRSITGFLTTVKHASVR